MCKQGKSSYFIYYGFCFVLIIGLSFASYYFGQFLRVRDIYIYEDGDEKIAIAKKAIPDCCSSIRLYLRTFYSLEDSTEQKEMLINELEKTMEIEREKLKRREQYLPMKYKKRILETLKYPIK